MSPFPPSMSSSGGSATTRWTVVLAAADGDANARVAFAERYLPVVRAYLSARWNGRRQVEDVEDAVQDVFLDCLRKDGALTRLDPEQRGSFRAFLGGVARNIALRVESRDAKERRRVADRDPSECADEDARLTTVFERAWAQSVMREAGDRLAAAADAAGGDLARRTELLRLHYHEGRAIADVADDWGMAPKAAYRALDRARGEFRTILRRVIHEREGISGAALDRCCADLLAQLR
ncbi:MAG: sigma-70 family RNA polymerase sigma factor [Planctomycetota bacterium]